MAFITQKPHGRWELRESLRTERGPRSRTLATFERLTDAVLEHAASRATRPFDPAKVRAAARRAAVPIDLPPAEQAARVLAAELAHGARLTPALSGVLSALLAETDPPVVSDAAKAAAQWANATPQEHGDTLVDLLLLADALPRPRRERVERFPRIESAAEPTSVATP